MLVEKRFVKRFSKIFVLSVWSTNHTWVCYHSWFPYHYGCRMIKPFFVTAGLNSIYDPPKMKPEDRRKQARLIVGMGKNMSCWLQITNLFSSCQWFGDFFPSCIQYRNRYGLMSKMILYQCWNWFGSNLLKYMKNVSFIWSLESCCYIYIQRYNQ